MRALLLALFAILMLVAITAGYMAYTGYSLSDLGLGFLDQPATATAPPPQKEAPPTSVTAQGTIMPRQRAVLAFKLGGRVVQVPVKEGDEVHLGYLLAKLDNTDLQNQVNQAEAALNLVHIEFKRVQAGATPAQRQAAKDALAVAQAKYDEAKGKITGSALKALEAAISEAKSAVAQLDPTPEALAEAQARVDQAQVALDSAKAALDDAALTAPFAATVAQLNVNVGDFVAPGSPVAIVGDLTSLHVESSDITDIDIARVRLGQSVNVTLDALPGQVFHGTVSRISPMAIESRGYQVFRVWVDLKEGTDRGLRWGMSATIEIPS